MAELIDVANAMFKNKNKWSEIQKKDKERFFFIFNRYFSRMYPNNSHLLNLKNVNKSIAMDIWYNFMLDKPYPKWFWAKSKKPINDFSDSDYKLLLNKLKIKKEDLDYLIKNQIDFIKQELKHFKKQN
jgi:hypothetical protein